MQSHVKLWSMQSLSPMHPLPSAFQHRKRAHIAKHEADMSKARLCTANSDSLCKALIPCGAAALGMEDTLSSEVGHKLDPERLFCCLRTWMVASAS